MGNELAVIEPEYGVVIRAPQEVIDAATDAAKSLTNILKRKSHKVMIKGEQYPEYDDWQTLGQFYGVTARTGDAVPIEIDGVKGAKAIATLIDYRTGLVVGGAEAYCLRDEENWKSKPWFQLASMAQTRAGAKALRNRLAWVMVLAGLRSTPAEEMDRDETEAPKSKSSPGKKVANTTAPTKTQLNPEDIKNWGQLFTVCYNEFGYDKATTLNKLGVSDTTELVEKPSECYKRLIELK